MTDEPMELPVYIVTGPNWTMVVPLDEYNAQFDYDSQIYEAATRAIEQLKGLRADLDLTMNPDSKDENPQLGTTVIVTRHGEKNPKEEVLCAHILMGNIGIYKEAQFMEDKMKEQIAAIRKKQQEDLMLQQELQQFNQQIKALPAPEAKPEKPRKKK